MPGRFRDALGGPNRARLLHISGFARNRGEERLIDDTDREDLSPEEAGVNKMFQIRHHHEHIDRSDGTKQLRQNDSDGYLCDTFILIGKVRR